MTFYILFLFWVFLGQHDFHASHFGPAVLSMLSSDMGTMVAIVQYLIIHYGWLVWSLLEIMGLLFCDWFFLPRVYRGLIDSWVVWFCGVFLLQVCLMGLCCAVEWTGCLWVATVQCGWQVFNYLKMAGLGWRWSLVVKLLPSMCEAFG